MLRTMVDWIIRADALQPVPWRNGRGVSRRIVGATAGGRTAWEASIADLDRDADFSDYTGCDRIFTPIAGQVALAFGAGPFEACPLLTPRPFAGEAAVRCRVDAPGRAFNLILDRARHRGTVTVLRLRDGDGAGAAACLHVLHGALRCGDQGAGPGDSVLDRTCTAVGEAVVLSVQVD